jgi:hypothetical protein
MTTIRATCPRCGEVDMTPEDILLSVRTGGREGRYRFVCPSCEESVEKRADRRIVALLVSAGVDVASVVSSLTEIGARPDVDHTEDPRRPLPPFTNDDLERFHELLRDDRWPAEFLDQP